MSDRELRFEILKCLKNRYDENPHSFVYRDPLLRDLNVSPIELDRNIKYLNDKYLGSVENLSKSTYMNWNWDYIPTSCDTFHNILKFD